MSELDDAIEGLSEAHVLFKRAYQEAVTRDRSASALLDPTVTLAAGMLVGSASRVIAAHTRVKADQVKEDQKARAAREGFVSPKGTR